MNGVIEMGLAPEATIEEFVNITVSSIVASLSYQVPYTPTYLEGSSGAGGGSLADQPVRSEGSGAGVHGGAGGDAPRRGFDGT